MGAVFNRDFPGNRGRRPLPPTINFYLNNLEFYVVSYKVSGYSALTPWHRKPHMTVSFFYDLTGRSRPEAALISNCISKCMSDRVIRGWKPLPQSKIALWINVVYFSIKQAVTTSGDWAESPPVERQPERRGFKPLNLEPWTLNLWTFEPWTFEPTFIYISTQISDSLPQWSHVQISLNFFSAMFALQELFYPPVMKFASYL